MRKETLFLKNKTNPQAFNLKSTHVHSVEVLLSVVDGVVRDDSDTNNICESESVTFTYCR